MSGPAAKAKGKTRSSLRYWLIGSVPFIGIFLITWLPFINGPHLWFGLPAIFVWLALFSTIPVTAVLLYFEKTRTDLAGDDE